jgi:hypothetical protein
MLKPAFIRIFFAALLAALVALPPGTLPPGIMPPTALAQDAPLRLRADAVPQSAADATLAALGAAGVNAELAGEGADLRLVAAGAGDSLPFERVFAPVVRLSSTLDGITLAELKAVWTGAGKSANFARVYVTADEAALLAPLLGAAGANVKTVAGEGLEAAMWGDKAGIGLLPFDALAVRLRALKVDGQSPVDNRFDAAKWPLTYRAALVGETDRGRAALSARAGAPLTNRAASKLTVLVMTGVTAMARHSAVAIDKSGDYGFLARKVGPELAAADITTISNEIPFVAGCVANPSANNLVFCSKPEYWENLALSGVDAVGLSGNHLLDFGRKASLDSLAFYAAKGVPVYGGGANEKAALAPLVLEHNGNRIGFLAAKEKPCQTPPFSLKT